MLYQAVWRPTTALPPFLPATLPPEHRVASDVFARFSTWKRNRIRLSNERKERERAHQESEAREHAAALLSEAESKGRRCWLRFGDVPVSGVSHNHRDDRSEAGVSVYRGWMLPGGRAVLDLRNVDRVSAFFTIESGEPLYEVEGTYLEVTGSDGEPLIAGATARPVENVSIQSVRY